MDLSDVCFLGVPWPAVASRAEQSQWDRQQLLSDLPSPACQCAMGNGQCDSLFFLKTNQKMVTNSDIEVLNVKVGVKKAIILLLQHTKIKVF
jgi:hypothetical protein